MRATLTLLVTIAIIVGVATYYNPGVMDIVVRNRTTWGQLKPDVSRPFVALMDCSLIGHKVWIWWVKERVFEGPFIVADCAARKDIPALKRKRFAVDVEWRIARKHGMKGPVPVRVFVEKEERPSRGLETHRLGLLVKEPMIR